MKRRHAAYFLALAQQAEQFWDTLQEWEWLERLEAERNNLRAALRWAFERQEDEFALRMNADLYTFWGYRSSLIEARNWLEGSLAMPRNEAKPAAMAAEAKALNALGYTAVMSGDFARAESHFQRGLSGFSELGDKQGITWSLRGCGFVAMLRGDLPRAQTYVERSLAMCRESQDEWREWGQAWSIYDLGYIALARGDLAQAKVMIEDGLARFRRHGVMFGAYRAHIALGHVLRLQKQLTHARGYYHEALLLQQKSHFLQHLADALEGVATVAAADEDPVNAARRFGAAQMQRESSTLARIIHHEQDYQRSLAFAQAQLEQDAWVAAWDKGRAMTLDQAVAYALDEGHFNAHSHA